MKILKHLKNEYAKSQIMMKFKNSLISYDDEMLIKFKNAITEEQNKRTKRRSKLK